MANTYCTATHTGHGFFTLEDRNDFYLSCHPGPGYGETPPGAMVWVVGNKAAGLSWIKRVSGTAKVKADAQAIVDSAIEAEQAAYDAESEEYKAKHDRREKYTLP